MQKQQNVIMRWESLMWTGLTLGPSLFTNSHKSFSISYKIENCLGALFLCAKVFCLV